MSLDLPGVMRGLAAALAALPAPGGGALRALAFPLDSVTPPAAIVAFPDGDVEYDELNAGGGDRARLEVFVVVGRPNERGGYEALASYMSGAGASSVKAAIEAAGVPESGSPLAVALDGGTVRVEASRLEAVNIGEVLYLAAGFTIDTLA